MTDPAPQAPRRRGRLVLRLAVGAVVALGALVWFLPSLLSSAWMRPTVHAWLNRSPDQRIDFGGLALSWGDGLRLDDVAVHDVRSGAGAPYLTVEEVAIDVAWRPLLDKRIVADEFAIRGLVLDLSHEKPAAPGAPKEAPPSLPEGTFGLAGARVPVEVRDALVKFAKGEVRIASADVLATVEQGALVLDPIDAKVNDGTVKGTARVELEGASPSHRLELHAEDVELDEYLAPLGARILPLLAGAPGDGKTTGDAGLDLAVEARGRRAEELKTSLRGEGKALLSDVRIEARTWLTEVLSAIGRGGDAMALEPVDVRFRIADGVVAIDETDVRSDAFVARTGGRVTLDGELDTVLRVKPAGEIRAFDKYARALDPDGYLPLHLTGSVTGPKVGLPGLGDVLAGALKSTGIEEKARGALSDLLGGGRDEKEDAPAREGGPREEAGGADAPGEPAADRPADATKPEPSKPRRKRR